MKIREHGQLECATLGELQHRTIHLASCITLHPTGKGNYVIILQSGRHRPSRQFFGTCYLYNKTVACSLSWFIIALDTPDKVRHSHGSRLDQRLECIIMPVIAKALRAWHVSNLHMDSTTLSYTE